MLDLIVSNLINGLLSGAIKNHELVDAIGLEPTLVHHYEALIEKAKTDDIAKNQLSTWLALYLVESNTVHVEDRDAVIRQLKRENLFAATGVGLDEARRTLAQSDSGFAHAVASIPLPVFILGEGLIATYRSEKKKRELKTSMAQLVECIEMDCKKQHQFYHLLCKNYEHMLETHAQDPVKTQSILAEWEQINHYFKAYIKKSQQNIACLGAEIQQTESQARVSKVKTTANLLAYGLHAIGPVGTILGTSINGIATFAGMASIEFTAHTARHNHAVLPNSTLTIQDQTSLKHALNLIRRLDSAIIKFDAPIIASKPAQKPQDIVRAFKRDHPDQLRCQIPLYPEETETDSSATNLDMTATDLLVEQARVQQVTLWKEIKWYREMIHTLTTAYQPNHNWPVITNLQTIQDDLLKKSDHLNRRIAHLTLNPTDEKRSQAITESIQRLSDFQTLTQSLLDDFHHEKNDAANTIYHALLHPSSATSVTPETENYQTFCRWQRAQISHKVESLKMLLNACIQIKQGRIISNLPELLSEIHLNLSTIRSSLSETEYANIQSELQLFYHQSIALDKARLAYLERSFQQGGMDHNDYLHELHVMKNRLLRYPRPYIDATAAYLIDVIITPRIETIAPQARQQLSRLSCIREDLVTENTVFICPSRQAFGLSKIGVIVEEVKDKTQQLLSRATILPRSIQILPLTPCDWVLLASARGDEKKLGDIVEGLKTEIQWVNMLCTQPPPTGLYTENEPLPINNLLELRQYYAAQIEYIERVISDREQLMNDRWENTFASHHDLDPTATRNQLARAGSLATNVLRSSTAGQMFLRNVQTELKKCKQALAVLDIRTPTKTRCTDIKTRLADITDPTKSSARSADAPEVPLATATTLKRV